MSDVEIQSAGLLILMWAFGLLTMGAVWGFVEAERRAANQADEAEFKDKLDEVREHQNAHAPARLPLRSRVTAGLHAARLRVAAARGTVAAFRGRMVVRLMEEPLLAPARSWTEINQKTPRYQWPTNPAPRAVEPVETPEQFLARIKDQSRLVQERSEAERLTGANTGLMPRIKEPVAS